MSNSESSQPQVGTRAVPDGSREPLARSSTLLAVCRRWFPEALIGAAIWLATLCWPITIPAEELEVTWAVDLHYGLAQGWQWGRDIIFTYGPLGFALVCGYDSHTYPWFLLWNFTIHALSVSLLLYFARSLPNRPLRILFLLLFFLLTPFIGQYLRDRYYIVVLVLSAGAIVMSERPRWLTLNAFSLLAAVLALTKFTILTLNAALIALIIPRLIQQRGWRAPLLLVAAFTLELLLGWGIARQEFSFSAWQAYWKSSREIAAGYSLAMTLTGDSAELMTGIEALAAFGLLLAVTLWWDGFRLRSWLMAAILGMSTFLLWKLGFVRHDGHCLILFSCLPVLTFLVLTPRFPSRWRVLTQTSLMFAIFSLCWYGFYQRVAEDQLDLRPNRVAMQSVELSKQQLLALLSPRAHAAHLDEKIGAKRRLWNYDQIAQRVGDEPVAWLMNGNGVAILNGFNLAPVGVPQSYSAYTEWLANENARHFSSAAAPRFVVVRFDRVEQNRHWPMQDDGPALLEIISNYKPLLNQAECLLFERRASNEPAGSLEELLLEQEFRSGDVINLSSAASVPRVFSMDVKLSPIGRIRTALLRCPPIWLECHFNDGTLARYRIVPDLCRAWSLLDPVVLDRMDFVKLIAGAPLRQVASVRVVVAPEDASAFEDIMEIRVRRYDPRLPIDMITAQKLLLPAVYTKPLELDSPRFGITAHGANSLLILSAPGRVKLPLAANKRVLTGGFGILPKSAETIRDNGGAEFSIDLVSPDGKSTNLLRRSCPAPGETIPQTFEIPIPSHSGGELLFQTRSQNEPAFDLFWSDIKVE